MNGSEGTATAVGGRLQSAAVEVCERRRQRALQSLRKWVKRGTHLIDRLNRPGESPGERSRLTLLVRSRPLRDDVSSSSSTLGRSGPGTSESVELSPSIAAPPRSNRPSAHLKTAHAVAWTRGASRG